MTYGFTTLGLVETHVARLLELVRLDWDIQASSLWLRDTIPREDASCTATGNIVQLMTGIRCAAVTLLHGCRQAQGAP